MSYYFETVVYGKNWYFIGKSQWCPVLFVSKTHVQYLNSDSDSEAAQVAWFMNHVNVVKWKY